MARYEQSFKDKAVAQLLPPRSAAVEAVIQSTELNRPAPIQCL
jgi:hypothetical protein